MIKTCTQCEIPKAEEEFSLYTASGRAAECKVCHREHNNKRNRALRIKVLIHYGGDPPKCACCGENHLEFLALDHIHGGGSKQRKTIKIRWWEWLRKQGLPEGFRVLCHNCNQSIGVYGYCPHTGHSKLKDAPAAYDEFAPNKAYKLTPDQVRDIRISKETGVALSARYKVSRATISLIKSEERWTNLTNC